MDIQTFYRLTPDEFEIIYNQWAKLRNGEFEVQWEQTRLIAFWSSIENLKDKNLRRFMPLPWDKKKTQGKGERKTEKAHDPERFERLKAKYGGTI